MVDAKKLRESRAKQNLIDALYELISNNSNIECEDSDTMLISGISELYKTTSGVIVEFDNGNIAKFSIKVISDAKPKGNK